MNDVAVVITDCLVGVCAVVFVLLRAKYRSIIKRYEVLTAKQTTTIAEQNDTIAKQIRVIDSLNKQVSRLNKKARENRLITTMEDLKHEQIGFEGDNRVPK